MDTMTSFYDQAKAFLRLLDTRPLSITDLLIVIEGVKEAIDPQVLCYYAEERHDVPDTKAMNVLATLLQKKLDLDAAFLELLKTTFDGEEEGSYPEPDKWDCFVALTVLMNHSQAPLTTYASRIEKVRSMFADVREGVPANIPCMKGFLALREAMDLLPWTFQQMNQVTEYYREWGTRFPVPWTKFGLRTEIVRPGLFDTGAYFCILPLCQNRTDNWTLASPELQWTAVQFCRNGKYILHSTNSSEISRIRVTQGHRLTLETTEAICGTTEGMNLEAPIIIILTDDSIQLMNSSFSATMVRTAKAPLLFGYSNIGFDLNYLSDD